MLLYHYIISAKPIGPGKETLVVDNIGPDERKFPKQLVVMPLILSIFILTPFAWNHKLR